ncbi:MAG: hypothetical protein ACI4IW_08300 [Oscillospiraceae bacterium]
MTNRAVFKFRFWDNFGFCFVQKGIRRHEKGGRFAQNHNKIRAFVFFEKRVLCIMHKKAALKGFFARKGLKNYFFEIKLSHHITAGGRK